MERTYQERTCKAVAKVITDTLDENGEFDCAIPQSFYDDIQDKYSVNPQGHIVTFYAKPGSDMDSGFVPVTMLGYAILYNEDKIAYNPPMLNVLYDLVF